MCSTRVNPVLEEVRCDVEISAQKRRDECVSRAEKLLAACDHASLLWYHLPEDVRRRVCRVCDTGGAAQASRGWQGLARRLGADHVNTEWYRQQTRGQLCGPTELLLADVHQCGRAPLEAAVVLHFLLDHGHWHCLSAIGDTVLQTCAARQLLVSARATAQQCDNDDDDDSAADSSCLESGVESLTSSGDLNDVVDVKVWPSLLLGSAPAPAAASVEVSLESAPVVLLTYVGDGRETALAVASSLKRATVCRPALRVFLLEEQRRWTQPDYYAVVQRWLEEVNYVVAVLTPDYLAATQNQLPDSTAAPWRHAQLARDARFLYTLMCARLEKYDYVNWWFRAVFPRHVLNDIRHHPLFGSPLFRWPFPVDCLEKLAECMTV